MTRRDKSMTRRKWISVAIIFLALSSCAPFESYPDSVEKIFGSTGLGFGEFSYPRAIAVSPVDGRVFVVDKSARIQRFGPDGVYQTGWRMPEWEHGKPTGLTVDAQNRLWVADTHYSRVIVYEADGAELFRFGSQGEGPGQFIFPTSVALDADGVIYVGEYGGNDRISKFSPDRTYLKSFADRDSGDAGLARPTEILVDPQGVLWVADACHHRICRYDREGRFLGAITVIREGRQELNYPYGLVLETGGTLLIVNHGDNRLIRCDRQGRFLAEWGTTGRAPGQLLQPWDAAVGRKGRVYVLDSWNNRVQVIRW